MKSYILLPLAIFISQALSGQYYDPDPYHLWWNFYVIDQSQSLIVENNIKSMERTYFSRKRNGEIGDERNKFKRLEFDSLGRPTLMLEKEVRNVRPLLRFGLWRLKNDHPLESARQYKLEYNEKGMLAQVHERLLETNNWCVENVTLSFYYDSNNSVTHVEEVEFKTDFINEDDIKFYPDTFFSHKTVYHYHYSMGNKLDSISSCHGIPDAPLFCRTTDFTQEDSTSLLQEYSFGNAESPLRKNKPVSRNITLFEAQANHRKRQYNSFGLIIEEIFDTNTLVKIQYQYY